MKRTHAFMLIIVMFMATLPLVADTLVAEVNTTGSGSSSTSVYLSAGTYYVTVESTVNCTNYTGAELVINSYSISGITNESSYHTCEWPGSNYFYDRFPTVTRYITINTPGTYTFSAGATTTTPNSVQGVSSTGKLYFHMYVQPEPPNND